MLNPDFASLVAQCVLGPDRSALTPPLWVGLRGASGDIDHARVPVDLDDFTSADEGVSSVSDWELGIAETGFTVTHLVLWTAAMGGDEFLVAELDTPATVAVDDVVVLPAGRFKVGVA